jgi:RNA polymerase sigma-70 factor, ECF subfamily
MDKSKKIESLWKSMNSGLKSFIISKVKDEEAAKDILQEVFIKVHDNIDSLKNNEKLQSWIYQITRNQIIDHFRENTKKLNANEINLSLLTPAVPGRFMEEAIRDMVKMIDELPPEYCEALCLTGLEGMSQKEFAEKLGISYSGAKSRVQRARVMLKDIMMKCCHYEFDKYGTVFEIHPACCCCCNNH